MDKSKCHFILMSEELLFVPYLEGMVETYHSWMQDPEVLYNTGSEPLTLEEEYQNQESWLLDKTKYTFIIMKPRDIIETLKVFDGMNSKELGSKLLDIADMVGDINLFFHNYIEENEAEIDIMIGEKKFRNKGYGQRSLQIMMDFGYTQYSKNQFIAKIKETNTPSIKLFEKIGFKEIKRSEVFKEIHFSQSYQQNLSKLIIQQQVVSLF